VDRAARSALNVEGFDLQPCAIAIGACVLAVIGVLARRR
jgi:hypothetical protein